MPDKVIIIITLLSLNGKLFLTKAFHDPRLMRVCAKLAVDWPFFVIKGKQQQQQQKQTKTKTARPQHRRELSRKYTKLHDTIKRKRNIQCAFVLGIFQVKLLFYRVKHKSVSKCARHVDARMWDENEKQQFSVTPRWRMVIYFEILDKAVRYIPFTVD